MRDPGCYREEDRGVVRHVMYSDDAKYEFDPLNISLEQCVGPYWRITLVVQ